jgi:hypothetical protein
MAVDIKVIKLKVRRGTNAQRRRVILDQGEIGYTTDTQRLFVGNGVLSGGVPAGCRVFAPQNTTSSITSLPAEIGDLVYAEGKLYQLINQPAGDINSWLQVGIESDNVYLGYDGGTLTLLENSIDGTRLNQQSLSSETITFNTDSLQINYSTSNFGLSGIPQKFAIKQGGVTEVNIASTALSSGLNGGNGIPLTVKVDNQTLSFDTNGRLTVIGTPLTAVTHNQLNRGFSIDPVTNTVDTIVQGVDSTTFSIVSGRVTLNGGFSSRQELPMFQVNDKGLVNLTTSSIYDVLTGSDSTFTTYNGWPEMTYAQNSGTTKYDVLSNFSGSVVTKYVQSAGYIVFQGNYGTRQRPSSTITQPFIIPVFKFTPP